MNTKKIQILYDKKIQLFKKYNQYYFEKSKPLVSDKDFDDLKKEILKLENIYKFLQSENSPSNYV